MGKKQQSGNFSSLCELVVKTRIKTIEHMGWKLGKNCTRLTTTNFLFFLLNETKFSSKKILGNGILVTTELLDPDR